MELGIGGLGRGVVVGAGASSTVYRATQIDLGRDVAVKVLNATDEAFVRRFRQEAKTLGKLSLHSGIVTVYDSGVNEAGRPYLILELCQDSLLDQLKRSGRFDPLEACSALADVVAAVGSAHAAGIVHRDLKPANLLRTSGDDILVTDFGIATTTAAAESNGSAKDNGGFTAGYAAPEVIGGQTAGPPADVYGLGATLFHLVVGQAPFVGSGDNKANLLVVVQRIANDPVSGIRPPGIPDPVWEIIEKAMAKDPSARPTLEELGQQLRDAVGALTAADPPSKNPDSTDNHDSPDSPDNPDSPDSPDSDAGEPEIAPPRLPSRTRSIRPKAARATDALQVSDGSSKRLPMLYGLAAVLAGIALTVALLFVLSDDGGTSNNVAAGAGDPSDTTPSSVAEPALAPAAPQPGSQQSGSFDPAGPPELRANLDSAARRITVPKVSGETKATAEARLTAAGLRVNVVYRETSSVSVGRVISQDPADGEMVFEDTLVTIFVSRVTGVPPVAVPPVAGMSASKATAALRAGKLTVAETLSIYSDTVPAGAAVGTDPSADTLVNANGSVTLFVSLGRPVVPTMAGLTADQAVAKLAEVTLVAELVNGPGTKPLGTVERTTPGPGTAVDTNSTVQVLVVNIVIPPDCTMDVQALVHQAKAAAEALVVAAGCQVGPAPPQEYDDLVVSGSVVRGVLSGPEVRLVVSKGPEPVPVCDPVALEAVVASLPGMTRAAAASAIAQTNCTLGADLPAEPSETIAAGLVLRGEIVGMTVRLVLVEAAPVTCTVPVVIGRSIAGAKQAIRDAGCTGPILDGGADPAAVVTGSAPAGGAAIPITDPITLTAPAVLVTVPPVVGMAAAGAKAALEAVGLVGVTVDVPLPEGDPGIGLVLGRQPAAAQLPIGSTVTLTVGVEAPPDTAPPGTVP